MRSLFITATGTDIGKTYISGLIVKKMREYGFNCGYFKPVLSGAVLEDGKLVPGDCKFVIEMAGLDCEPTNCLSYCFKEAVSPHLAAARQGVNIDTKKIIQDFNTLSKNYDYVLIEGAGGITCPLAVEDNRVTLLSDLVKLMEQDVLLVADGGLGTINSVLTSVEYIRAQKINIVGIVLNNFDKTDFMHKDNLVMVEKLTGLNVVATVAHGEKDIDINIDVLKDMFKEG